MKIRRRVSELLKQNRGMIGIEAAIVLIAFVVVAAAFAFMVVNMGLFATQTSKETVQQGITEASSPLLTDGSIYLRATSGKVDAMVIPLRTIGTASVSMAQSSTEVTLNVGNHTAIADVYEGINNTDPYSASFDTLVNITNDNGTTGTGAMLFIGNSNGNYASLGYEEKGLMVFYFAGTDQAAQSEDIYVEIRPGNSAPLSVDIFVPPDIANGWVTVGG